MTPVQRNALYGLVGSVLLVLTTHGVITELQAESIAELVSAIILTATLFIFRPTKTDTRPRHAKDSRE